MNNKEKKARQRRQKLRQQKHRQTKTKCPSEIPEGVVGEVIKLQKDSDMNNSRTLKVKETLKVVGRKGSSRGR